MPRIKFLNEGKEIEVAAGANLRKAALENGISLYPGIHRFLNCRGLAQCGSCMVLLRNGTAKNASRKGLLETIRLTLGWAAIGHGPEARLACQTRILGDLEVVTRPEFNWFGTAAKK